MICDFPILTEYNEERERRLLYAQGFEEGYKEGFKEGWLLGLAFCIRIVMEKLNYSFEDALSLLAPDEEDKAKLRPMFTA